MSSQGFCVILHVLISEDTENEDTLNNNNESTAMWDADHGTGRLYILMDAIKQAKKEREEVTGNPIKLPMKKNTKPTLAKDENKKYNNVDWAFQRRSLPKRHDAGEKK